MFRIHTLLIAAYTIMELKHSYITFSEKELAIHNELFISP